MTTLFAIHLSDGVVKPEAIILGFICSFFLLRITLKQLREEEIPRIALLSAGFFIASLIHFRIGPSSVHLILNGLVGVLLDRRSILAISTGIVLQTFLLSHGGISTIGLNILIIGLPALFSGSLFRLFLKQFYDPKTNPPLTTLAQQQFIAMLWQGIRESKRQWLRQG